MTQEEIDSTVNAFVDILENVTGCQWSERPSLVGFGFESYIKSDPDAHLGAAGE